jgi:peptidoglycan/LPS O-acetylase OafA/YrhL
MKIKRRYHFEFLDALRGLAILAVLFLHLSEHGRNSGDELVHRWIWPVLSHGYLGVQLFFVISGYCIVAAVYGMRGKERPIPQFLLRRVRRIFPPYWWSILLVAMLGFGTMMMAKKTWIDVFSMSCGDWLANVLLLQEPLQTPDLNMVYWSLSIEMQFYILMSFCLLSSDLAEFYLVVISIACAMLLSLQRAIPGTVLAYWPEFACGIAAFYWITAEYRWRGTPWLIAASAAVTAGVVWAQTNGAITEGETGHFSLPIKLTFCMVVGVVLICTYRFDAAISRLRISRIFAWLGTISYSLYLIHVPVATRVFNLGERATTLQGLRWLGYAAASFLVVLLCGVMFYRCCERPWLNRRAANSPIT